MIRGIRLASRALVAAIVLSAGMIPASPSARTPSPAATPDSGALTRIEVRLRKLHLVRPDLIPYPILYDVYC